MITPTTQRDPRGFQKIPYNKNYQTNSERNKQISEIEKLEISKVLERSTSLLEKKKIVALKKIDTNASAKEIEDEIFDALGEDFKKLINSHNNSMDPPISIDKASALKIEDQVVAPLEKDLKSLKSIKSKNNSIDPPILLETEEQIKKVYGDYFCKIAGIENLLKMPVVTAASLNIDTDSEFNSLTVRVKDLKENSTVKGLDGLGRPFIAVRMAHCDIVKQKKYSYVELIFRRHVNSKDDDYVSAIINRGGNGEFLRSVFYQGPNDKDFSQLKNLLEGKIIVTSLMNKTEACQMF